MSALSFQTPTPFLRKGCRVYQARLRIPADLLDAYSPRKELTTTLKTRDFKQAQANVRLWAISIDQEFAEHRRRLRQQREGELPSAPHQPMPHEADGCRPFVSLTETERQRLLALYPVELRKEAEKALRTPPPDDEARAMREWRERQDLLQALEGEAFTPKTPPRFFPPSAAYRELLRGETSLFLQAATLCLQDGDITPILPDAEAFLARHGIMPPAPAREEEGDAPAAIAANADAPHAANAPARAAFREFCLSLLERAIPVRRWFLALLDGETWARNASVPDTAFARHAGLPEPPGSSAPPAASAEQETAPAVPGADADLVESADNPRFSKVLAAYVREKGEALAPASRLAVRQSTARFMELAGDLPIRAYRKREHVIRYKDALLKLPRHLPRALAARPLPDILQQLEKHPGNLEGQERLSPTTINNKHLAFVRTVFRYALNNGMIAADPSEGVKAIHNRANIETEGPLPYSRGDLHKIFMASRLFRPEDAALPGCMGKLDSPENRDTLMDYQWFLLLGLYTGARIEELAQLDRADIRQENGVWFAHIRADAETGRRVKNRASLRKVPLHDHLLQMGFLETFARRGEGGKLFSSPGFPDSRNGRSRSNAFSKWFGRFIDSLTLEHGKRKRFHAFRHTLKREGRNKLLPDALLDGLQGHTQTGVAAQYGRDEEGRQYALPVLKEALDKIDIGLVVARRKEGLKA